MDLKVKKEQRFKVLEEIYRQSNGNSLAIINIDELCSELGILSNEVASIEQYLKGEGLIKCITMDGGVSITHRGVKEMEDAYEDPEHATRYFPPVNLIYVNSMNNSQIQQASIDSIQTFENSNKNIGEAIEKLIVALEKEKISLEKLEALIANIETIKCQVSLPEQYRNKTLLKKAWEYLNNASSLISVATFCNLYSPQIIAFIK